MRKKSNEELNNLLKEYYPNENLSIIKYLNMKSEVIIKCNTCNNEYIFSRAEQVLGPSKAKNKKWGICNKCTDTIEWKEQKEKFLLWLKNNDDWQLADDLSQIHNSQSHIKCNCKHCGRIQTNKKIYDYYNGKQCWCKNKGIKKPNDILSNELTNVEYEFLENYINTDVPILVRRKNCGHIFKARPHVVLHDKYYCPLCHASKGELRIAEFLDKYNISYYKEFHLYVDNLLLKVDFVIPEKNLYIEFNGIQHYEPVEHFGGIQQFQYQQNRDKKLEKYCKENNIKLLWIRYDEFNNIESILKGVMMT